MSLQVEALNFRALLDPHCHDNTTGRGFREAECLRRDARATYPWHMLIRGATSARIEIKLYLSPAY
jgi:hypothetical protein